MNQVVHPGIPAADCVSVGVEVPGVDHDRNVVVPVEKDQLLFAKDDKDGVSQLNQL